MSGIVKKYVEVDYLIGREFWKFISGDAGCMREVYELAERAGREVEKEKGISLRRLVDKTISRLTDQFEKIYGKSGPAMCRRLLKENS